MRIHPGLAVALACTACLGSAAGAPQSNSPTATTAAPPSTAPNDLKFGFDDLMTLLIQPRHLKLYYAGTRKNWELAAAEARNLRAGMSRIAQSIPVYLNLNVEDTTASLFSNALTSLDASIAGADPKRFAAAYSAVTAACNACHVYMEHPYIIIKVPDAGTTTAYPDQDFSSPP